MQLLHKNSLVTYFTHFSLLACIASSIRGHQIYQVSLFRMNVFSLRTRLSPFITFSSLYFPHKSMVRYLPRVPNSAQLNCWSLRTVVTKSYGQVIRTHGSSNKEFVLSSTCQPTFYPLLDLPNIHPLPTSLRNATQLNPWSLRAVRTESGLLTLWISCNLLSQDIVVLALLQHF